MIRKTKIRGTRNQSSGGGGGEREASMCVARWKFCPGQSNETLSILDGRELEFSSSLSLSLLKTAYQNPSGWSLFTSLPPSLSPTRKDVLCLIQNLLLPAGHRRDVLLGLVGGLFCFLIECRPNNEHPFRENQMWPRTPEACVSTMRELQASMTYRPCVRGNLLEQKNHQGSVRAEIDVSEAQHCCA